MRQSHSPTDHPARSGGEAAVYISQVKLNREYYPTTHYYPFNIPTIRATSHLTFQRSVTFFVGENGSGKSTLLEAITRKCGIHTWDRVRRHQGLENPYETRLADFIEVVWARESVSGSLFRAETFRDLVDFLDDVAVCDPGRLRYQGGKILSNLSHGQAMLSYFSGRYGHRGLYFLDEPEAALSPASQVKFLRLLHAYAVDGKAQFIIATHSPILLALPEAQIFSFDGPSIQEVRYEDTEHYKVYKQFFMDRERMLSRAAKREGVFVEREEEAPGIQGQAACTQLAFD